MGKRRTGAEQRTEETGERGENVLLKKRKRCEERERKNEGGDRGDAYWIGPLRVMAIVHVVY